MEKRHAASTSTEASSTPVVMERSYSHPLTKQREPWDHHHHPPQPAHPAHPAHPNNYRYPGPYQPQQPPPMASNSYGVPPRKRASPSNLPVQLPPKKQHMDMPEEFRYQKGTF